VFRAAGLALLGHNGKSTMAKSTPRVSRPSTAGRSAAADADAAVAWLKRHSSAKTRAGLSRYGIPSDNALGVAVGAIQRLATQLGKSHPLALALWDTRIYEARLLATFVDEPALVTAAQMDRWCRDFDNWGICDTACFKLFDRAPGAWRMVTPWCRRRDEFVRRAGVVLLACLALHDKAAPDARFLACLPLLERAAADDRNFVGKGVSWALRAIGGRSPALHAAVTELARRLAASADPAPRAVGKEALRDLSRPALLRRLSRARS
jgi:3-methyladenine DNA glycosylase AlkD